MSGTASWTERMVDAAVHNNRPNVLNVLLLFLMAYEYLSARVILQKYTEEINNNISFFIYFCADLGRVFSLTKKNGI